MATVRYNQANIFRLLHSPAEGVYQNAVASPLRKTDAVAKATCPVDTGRMVNLHSQEITDEGVRLVGTLKNTAEYALAVHQGHKPIVPVKGQYLKFEIGGRTVYTKFVRAVAGRPWLVNALKAVSPWPVTVFEPHRS